MCNSGSPALPIRSTCAIPRRARIGIALCRGPTACTYPTSRAQSHPRVRSSLVLSWGVGARRGEPWCAAGRPACQLLPLPEPLPPDRLPDVGVDDVSVDDVSVDDVSPDGGLST